MKTFQINEKLFANLNRSPPPQHGIKIKIFYKMQMGSQVFMCITHHPSIYGKIQIHNKLFANLKLNSQKMCVSIKCKWSGVFMIRCFYVHITRHPR